MSVETVSLEGISKSFGGVKVLNNVSFKLDKGAVHALVGGNGAGKSTLMKIMTGIYTADTGVVKMAGKKIEIHNYLDAQHHGIRMIFQELSLSPTLSITDNIFLAHEMKKGVFLDKRRMRAKTEQLLAQVGLDISPDEKVKDLDVGVTQLVEIAKALSMDPSVLVMDEPTASLTEKETDILFKIINKLKADGVSIVYISHKMKEIFQIADKVTVLRDGEIVSAKPIYEYTMESLIEDMIGQKVDIKMTYTGKSASDAPLMLEVENLNYRSKIRNLSFNLRKGEVLGFAGLMGTGRTETLETLFGLNKQGTAKIKIEGKEVRIRSVGDAINHGIVLIPEDRRRCGLVLKHNVKDNISLPNFKKLTRYKLISKTLVHKMANDSVKEFNIKTDFIDKLILNLSGGNQQKVVVAKWLKTNPKILLMDEPTVGIDIGAKSEIMELVRQFAREGKAVIFVSSELSELMAVCDRVLVFTRGEISMELARENIEGEGALQYAIQN